MTDAETTALDFAQNVEQVELTHYQKERQNHGIAPLFEDKSILIVTCSDMVRRETPSDDGKEWEQTTLQRRAFVIPPDGVTRAQIRQLFQDCMHEYEALDQSAHTAFYGYHLYYLPSLADGMPVNYRKNWLAGRDQAPVEPFHPGYMTEHNLLEATVNDWANILAWNGELAETEPDPIKQLPKLELKA